MNEHPTPYEPKRRSRVKVVKGASEVPVTLTHLVKGMVTGTLGTVPLTSDVYAQIPPSYYRMGNLIATVQFGDLLEVLGTVGGRVFRGYEPDSPDLETLPRLILTEGRTR